MDFAVIKTDTHGNITLNYSLATPVTINGIQKIVQIVVLKILKSPGQDIISPITGAGMLSVIQGNISDDPSEVLAELSPLVKKIESEIIEEQTNVDLPDSERLLKLNLVGIEQDPNNLTSYFMTIEIINEEEEIIQATVDSSLFDGRE